MQARVPAYLGHLLGTPVVFVLLVTVWAKRRRECLQGSSDNLPLQSCSLDCFHEAVIQLVFR
jgi:hypothetical protein